MIQYLNPIDDNGDTDDDGLKDKFEVLYHLTDVEINVLNSLPDSEFPDPIQKDIYIEVDWMVGGLTWGTSGWQFFVPFWGTYKLIAEYHNLLDECNDHKLSSDAIEMIINAFRDNPYDRINMHIDDGQGKWIKDNQGSISYTGDVGGGGSVPHKDVVKNANEYEYYYFDDEREDFFYYCVIGHNINYDFSKSVGRATGNSFILADKQIQTTTRFAHTFIHELGHLIIPDDADHIKDEEWFLKERWLPGDQIKGEHCCHTDCALYPGDLKPQADYCDDCWRVMDLSGGP